MPPRSRLRIDFAPIAPAVDSLRVFEREVRDEFRPRPAAPTTLEILRPEDLLHLRVRMEQMAPAGNGLWRPVDGQVGLIIYHFQPQHLFEFALQEPPIGTPPAKVDTFLARPSRVVIEVPAGQAVARTTKGLLEALLLYPMRLSAAARGSGPPRLPIAELAETIQPRDVGESARFGRLVRVLARRGRGAAEVAGEAMRVLRPAEGVGAIANLRRIEELILAGRAQRPAEPAANETSIEIPWRLLMSPTPGTRWTHRIDPPVESPAKRYELWHTRLAVLHGRARDESPGAPERQARAVWARDPGYSGELGVMGPFQAWEESAGGTDPWRLTISRRQREQIVALTSDGRIVQGHPVHVDRWMLTSQGGWIDLKGSWKPSEASAISLIGWDHRATLGRDQYVKIEEIGWLWPFGNTASVVTISERKLRPEARDKAFLWQRSYIRVLERYRQWPTSVPRDERAKPFHSIELMLDETPDVVFRKGALTPSDVVGADSNDAKLPFLGTRAFRFPVSAVDRDDQIVTFDLPMIFVKKGTAPSIADLHTLFATLGTANLGNDSRADLKGQRVAIAPSSDGGERPGDARLETSWLSLTSIADGAGRSIPQLATAGVVVEAIRALTGAAGPVEVKHHTAYLDHGLPKPGEDHANRAQLFVELPAVPTTQFAKGTDKVGGFLSPELAMSALSRLQGPVAGADGAKQLNAAVDGFQPGDFFGDLLDKARLFGTFSLASIIKPGDLGGAPKFVTEALDVVETVMREVQRWLRIAEQIWKTVQDAIKSIGALAAAATQVDPVAALELVLDQVWKLAVDGGRQAVLAKIAGLGIPDLDVPTDFTLGTWKVFLEKVADKAVDKVVEVVNGLVAKATAWLNSLLAGATAIAEHALALLSKLWSAWLQALAMLDVVAALPATLAGGDPGKAVDAIGGLLATVSSTFAELKAPLATALADVPGLDPRLRQDVTAGITTVADLFKNLDGTFKDGLGPALRAFAMAQDLARNLTVRYSWSTKLVPFFGLASPPDLPLFDPIGSLTLAGELRGKEVKGRPAGVDLSASIGQFKLNLISPLTFIALDFHHITFELKAGKKPELDVKFTGFAFKGPLEFLESLRKIIPLDGFSDPPALSITPQGIDASFSLALPSVAIGVFSLTNLSLSAGFSIPFIGSTPLNVYFAFCSRENPFTLTVSMLGGGGFFGLRLNPNGIETLEASLEFGAALSIDLGVASGSVSIMAGVYFKMTGSAVELTGYLRLRGVVDVLGLITASIELYMSLTYESSSGKVIGKAMIEVKVKVLFLSFSVKVEMEKRFAGSSGDPTFLEVMAPDDRQPLDPWDEYAGAFADAA